MTLRQRIEDLASFTLPVLPTGERYLHFGVRATPKA
jgi:hypothetical protein